MKKVYTTPAYKQRHKRRCRKFASRKRKGICPQKVRISHASLSRSSHAVGLAAPRDLRLFDNQEACLIFFRQLRSKQQLRYDDNGWYVQASLKTVEQIDHASISILIGITDDLSHQGISFYGNLPDDKICKQFMIDSGFLYKMHDQDGQLFPNATGADIICFERGCGKLSLQDIHTINEAVNRVATHLGDATAKCMPVRTIMYEIFGNSIEWGDTRKKQWLMGLKYEENRVIFSLTDVGRGILETLHRKFFKHLGDAIHFRQQHEVLLRAFMQKYGSASGDKNRNKGLPDIRDYFEKGFISRLKVVTNNVFLDFEDPSQSKTIFQKKAQFGGTFYQWEMTPASLQKIKNS